MCFIFFFSSRRRHTRLQGDWSSDVCSSDLPGEGSSIVKIECRAQSRRQKRESGGRGNSHSTRPEDCVLRRRREPPEVLRREFPRSAAEQATSSPARIFPLLPAIE